jgi:hypothetical protein
MKVLKNIFTTPQGKEEDRISQSLQEDLESPNEPQICASVVDFDLKGKGELTIIGYALRLGGLSTTPSSIVFIELSIVEFVVAVE